MGINLSKKQMITILSPAKKLNLLPPNQQLDCSIPHFLNNTKHLINILNKLSVDQIQNLMNISDNIANLNFKRFQDLTHDSTIFKKKSHIALFTFDGEVYNGLNPSNFTSQELTFANHNLRILSGLYGILKPLDLIQPYRLEMGTKLINHKGKNLYKFWQTDLTKYFNNLNTDTIINLASIEYYSALNEKELSAEIITPIFKEYKNGSYKTIMMYAKKARGLMAKYIIENEITDWKKLQNFNVEKYIFNSKMSEVSRKNKKLVFTR